MDIHLYGAVPLILALVLVACAVLAAPCVVTVLVLRYISTKRFPLLGALQELAETLAAQLQPPEPPAEPQAPPVPIEIEQYALRESEAWAREDTIRRARQLYADYDDGRSPAELVWARVLSRLQQGSGDVLND